MDDTDFVSIFCTELARSYKRIRAMYSWYVWSDKRDGTIRERFEADAADFMEYRKLFTC
jgi:hypothetical protein